MHEFILDYFGNKMVRVSGGIFDMGDVLRDNEYDDEKPVHRVMVSDFYMSAYCVTFEEYDKFCAATGRQKPDDEGWGRGRRPVINVNWYDAVEYCNWLSQQQGLPPVYAIDKTRKDPNNNNDYDDLKWIVIPNRSANGYRLPTEAEWEYAAREGGKKVRFGNGQNILRHTEANYKTSEMSQDISFELGAYRGSTVPVNIYTPNALGLYNMSGNVCEWCWDWYDQYYLFSEIRNPHGPDEGTYKVLRGGSWTHVHSDCRTTVRITDPPNCRFRINGFRVCRGID